jgi:hypothetical protein
MKYLLFIILILCFSCEKYKHHDYVCSYLRTNTLTGDTLINIPLDSMQALLNVTEDYALKWMQDQRDMKFEVCEFSGDTTWITNKVHCLEAVCPKKK